MDIALRRLHAHGGEEEGGADPLIITIKLIGLWVIWILGFVFGLLPYFV